VGNVCTPTRLPSRVNRNLTEYLLPERLQSIVSKRQMYLVVIYVIFYLLTITTTLYVSHLTTIFGPAPSLVPLPFLPSLPCLLHCLYASVGGHDGSDAPAPSTPAWRHNRRVHPTNGATAADGDVAPPSTASAVARQAETRGALVAAKAWRERWDLLLDGLPEVPNPRHYAVIATFHLTILQSVDISRPLFSHTVCVCIVQSILYY
jgi:hypothetical protein